MIDREFIGHTFVPYETVIEAGRLRLFCKAIGETNALHIDKTSAIEAGYRNLLAPLTFPTTIAFDNPNPRCVYELLDVKIEWVLHGEEAYEFGAPICVGDTITSSWKITDIYDKKGGAMQFIAVAVDMTNQFDDVVCVAKRLLIVRQPQ